MGKSESSECSAPITPSSLLSTLDQFLYFANGATDRKMFSYYKGKNVSDSAGLQLGIDSALFLLKNLPPARSAALSYVAEVLSKQVFLRRILLIFVQVLY